MKKLVLLSMLSFFTFSNEIFAQPGRGIARSIVKKEMKKKHAEPQKEKGREGIKEATYNDKDAVVPMNQRGSATLKMEYRTFKKNGNVDEEIHSLFESSTVGELITSSTLKKKKTTTTKVLMKYDENAHYFINEEERTATKMPMRHLQKAMMKSMEGYMQNNTDQKGTWTATGNKATINGFNCSEYIYVDEDGNKQVFWLATNVFKKPLYFHSFLPFPVDIETQKEVGNAPFPKNATIIKAEFYENDVKVTEFEIKSYQPTSNPSSFDLSNYRVVDVLDGL